jgi:GTP-binding protein
MVETFRLRAMERESRTGMAPRRETKKRLGKKHRKASTRPKLGRNKTKGTAVTGAVAPKARKKLSTKRVAAEKAARTPLRSPEKENRRTIAGDVDLTVAPRNRPLSRLSEARANAGLRAMDDASEESQWRAAEALANELSTAAASAASHPAPLFAICGRPNVGKSTLFNRITGTRRSIVGDEPGITRDRIYGEVEWAGRNIRIVDTGGIVPDDEALIPSEIFRQAQVALDEASVIVQVIDGRTELAAPDLELSRLLLRGGKPCFLAINKMDTAELAAQVDNYRRFGFRDVFPISAEHGTGIGDLLDEVFAMLPPETVGNEPDEILSSKDDELDEDSSGPQWDDSAEGAPDEDDREALPESIHALGESEAEAFAGAAEARGEQTEQTGPTRERRLRSHGEFIERETRVAIIGRPNAGKSTLLNALTGTDRAIVSPIAGTTRDAVDEVVTRAGHNFRFVDTAGIRRKGKTKLMAEKLSVIMARKHLEAADVSLLVIDAAEGVTAADANIGGYAHESGRSVIIVVNKWDLMTQVGDDGNRLFDGKPPADKKIYEEQVRDSLKYLEYAPLVFLSAVDGKGIDPLFKKIELVSRERRKRVTTGQMNRFLDRVDFQKASVPMSKRIKIYYMTQAAVAPPTFVLFTDKSVKLHFSYERFLANQIRDTFSFIGSPIWFKVRARNKKKDKE